MARSTSSEEPRRSVRPDYQPSRPTARGEMACSTANGRIYVMGGRDCCTSFATVEEYDPLTDKWTTRANIVVHECGESHPKMGFLRERSQRSHLCHWRRAGYGRAAPWRFLGDRIHAFGHTSRVADEAGE